MKRRQFLKNSLAIGLGSTLIPRWIHPLLAQSEALRAKAQNRILVILNLGGGNDGLNTIIPYEDDAYYNLRPNIAIPQNELLPITNTLGFHPAMSFFMDIWNRGNMAIIQNVGYDNQNLSHFRSTDIWRSASDFNENVTTGWVGRYLESQYSDYIENPPEEPIALQQGSTDGLLMTGDTGVPGVIIDDPSIFYALVNETYESEYNNDPPETAGGDELGFVRQIDNNSFAYAGVIQAAAEAGQNTVEYPNNSVGLQLSIVAKLLSGGMYTPIFLTHQYGYDTHANQPNNHQNLLSAMSRSIATFLQDIENQGMKDRVLLLTTSEFGRRPFENGSTGTDHGAAAPQFLFGSKVNGGIYGSNPNMTEFDNNENLLHEFDFRQLYATILSEWFDLPYSDIENILFHSFETFPIIDNRFPLNSDPSRKEGLMGIPKDYTLSNAYPNPFNPVTRLTYGVKKNSLVDIRVFDMKGREVLHPVHDIKPAGYYRLSLNSQSLASGNYSVVMKAGSTLRKTKITVVK
ncbi:MAG: DUF1501 domain-containing protein [Candidatus Marinimicrobia bacterium]|jgi:uncharacterized protein (DUF1501 family)|nr:DUF1501 domain-containing protein [Candidatus Neomarinimicrobiota bacterium]